MRWRTQSRRGCKRFVDIVGSASALVVLSPVLGLAAAAIRTTMGAPVLFRQVRAGKGGAPFELLKFRSMTSHRDASGALLPDDERITAIGRFLRTWAIDELPQLVNVLRGEMSLVGPRPLPCEYNDRYSARQARRHEMPPGLTGWAQVNGRNALSWAKRLDADVWYVENWSLTLDLRILARTPASLVSRIGVSAPDHATMPEFRGETLAGEDAQALTRPKAPRATRGRRARA